MEVASIGTLLCASDRCGSTSIGEPRIASVHLALVRGNGSFIDCLVFCAWNSQPRKLLAAFVKSFGLIFTTQFMVLSWQRMIGIFVLRVAFILSVLLPRNRVYDLLWH